MDLFVMLCQHKMENNIFPCSPDELEINKQATTNGHSREVGIKNAFLKRRSIVGVFVCQRVFDLE